MRSALKAYDEALWQRHAIVAGVDEAGRGPLAGPVVAGACILSPKTSITGINDSKKLTPRQRCELFCALAQDPDVVWAVGIVDVDVIDRINILQATMVAMRQALDGLSKRPTLAVVDGLALSHDGIPCTKVIGGDARSLCIAAASILAKETRDRLMVQLHQEFPRYGFDKHKGYGTEAHMTALQRFGPCPIHRRTFEPVKSLLVGAQ